MKYKKIFLPTSLDKINPKDSNIDVIVTADDDIPYVLVVATPQNLITLMQNENENFLSAGCPFAIVKELTMENIEALVNSFCENDGYWLKYYHYSGMCYLQDGKCHLQNGENT